MKRDAVTGEREHIKKREKKEPGALRSLRACPPGALRSIAIDNNIVYWREWTLQREK